MTVAPLLVNIKTYVVTSGSMKPLYPVGSVIYVKNIDPNTIKKNDIITFYKNGSVATHQVYEIDRQNQEFKTQGINNKDENGNIIHDAEPVKFSSLIGKPVFCIPYLGYIVSLIKEPPGIYIVIIVTILMLFINYILEKRYPNEK